MRHIEVTREEKTQVEDLLDRDKFCWRLRVAMEIADIRAGELVYASGLAGSTIHNARSGFRKPSEAVMTKLLLAVESWRPGSLDALRAAEKEAMRCCGS